MFIEGLLFGVSLCAAFGFSVSFILDEQYFPTGNLARKLIITYLICALIAIPSLVSLISNIRVNRRFPEVLVYTDDARTTLYVWSKGDYVTIPLSATVGIDDSLPAKAYHYFCGKTHRISDFFSEAKGKMILRYKDGSFVKQIPLWVDCVSDAEDTIFSLKEETGIMQCRDGKLTPLAKKVPAHRPAHFVIAAVIFLGCIGILAMLISFDIDDIDYYGYLNVKKIVIESFCLIVFGSLPLLLYIHNYRKHRYMPTDVVLTDDAKQNVYLFKNRNYVKLPVACILETKEKNDRISVYNTLWINYKRIGYYTYHDISDGKLTITCKMPNGVTRKFKYHVRDVYGAGSAINSIR